MSCALPGPRPTMNRTGRCGQDCACDSVCGCASVGTTSAASAALAPPETIELNFDMHALTSGPGPREYRRRGRTVNATHLPMLSDHTRRAIGVFPSPLWFSGWSFLGMAVGCWRVITH